MDFVNYLIAEGPSLQECLIVGVATTVIFVLFIMACRFIVWIT